MQDLYKACGHQVSHKQVNIPGWMLFRVIDERIQDIKVKGNNVSGLDIEDEVDATYGAMCCDP
jgi:hypothetical protein